MNGLQIFPNLVGVVGLSGVVARLLREDEAGAAGGGAREERALSGFERAGGELRCDGVSLAEAAREHGTPLYVYSRAGIEAGVPGLRGGLRAGAAPRLLRGQGQRQRGDPPAAGRPRRGGRHRLGRGAPRRAARRLPAGADRVRRGGQDGRRDRPRPRARDRRVERRERGRDRADRRRGAARGQVARVSLRVNPDIDPRSHPYISTGLREAKFGVAIGLAPAILRRARERAGVEVVGVQCHIGSQITDLEPLAAAARALAGPEPAAARRGLPPAHDRPRRRPRRELRREAGRPTRPGSPRPSCPRSRSCPSRSSSSRAARSVAGSGVLLTRVLYVKGGHDKKFVVVDAGMNDLLRPALYDAFHRVEPVVPRGRPAELVDVVGPVCETSDFLARRPGARAAGAGRPPGGARRRSLRLRHVLELQHAPARGRGPRRGRPRPPHPPPRDLRRPGPDGSLAAGVRGAEPPGCEPFPVPRPFSWPRPSAPRRCRAPPSPGTTYGPTGGVPGEGALRDSPPLPAALCRSTGLWRYGSTHSGRS